VSAGRLTISAIAAPIPIPATEWTWGTRKRRSTSGLAIFFAYARPHTLARMAEVRRGEQ